MKLILITGIGSFLGGISRYLLTNLVQEKTTTAFPYATLVINLAGCFLIGCLYGLAEKWELNLEWRLFMITGLLGGFTTFSAFSVETIHLYKTGHLIPALIYIFSSLFLGLGLTLLGATLFKFIPH